MQPEALSIAFFDLDGTLVVGNTQFLLVRFLHSHKIISTAFVVGSALWFVGYKARLFKVTEGARAKGASMLRGLSAVDVAALMNEFTQEVLLRRLHGAAVAALREHRSAGDRVVVVSAALDPVVRSLSDHLGVDEWYGAPCEVSEGRYTGKLSGPTPYGGLKAEVAADVMRRWGVGPDVCWAYADHVTDLELLRSVGHAVAVNPKLGMARAAREAGWAILP